MKRSDFVDEDGTIYVSRQGWVLPSQCRAGDEVRDCLDESWWLVAKTDEKSITLAREDKEFVLYYDEANQPETSSPDVPRDSTMNKLYREFNDILSTSYDEVMGFSRDDRTADSLMIELQQRLIEMLLEKQEKESE